MSFYNTYPGFLYRQFLVCPPKAPSTTSLRGKAGLVTGSNTGLGYQASAQLLALGLSHLILAVRSPSKGEAARKTLLASLPASVKPPLVEVWEFDLGSYASVTAFVETSEKLRHSDRLCSSQCRSGQLSLHRERVYIS